MAPALQFSYQMWRKVNSEYTTGINLLGESPMVTLKGVVGVNETSVEKN